MSSIGQLRHDLAVRLADARRTASMTISETARRIAVSRQTIFNWENAATEPTVTDLVRLAEVYRVPAASLLPVQEQTDLAGVAVYEDDGEI